MRLTVRTPRMGWSAVIDVPDKCLVGELRKTAAQAADVPPARARLILRGATLEDDSRIAPIKPDDTVLVALAPEPVNRGGRAGGTRDDDDDDDDDDDAVRFPFGRLDRARTSRTRLRLLRFLQHRVKLPEALAHGILRVRLRTYAGVVVWLTLCRASWRYDHAPLFLLATGFFLVFAGLGTKKPGEASAYSLFNENFRELPGNFNAGDVDRVNRGGGY